MSSTLCPQLYWKHFLESLYKVTNVLVMHVTMIAEGIDIIAPHRSCNIYAEGDESFEDLAEDENERFNFRF